MRNALGWLALGVLLSPLLVAAWVSLSPDSTLSPPMGRWSLRWYAAFLDDSRMTGALARSIAVASLAAVVAVVAGGMLALARNRSLSIIALLPAMVPPVALALGLMPMWRGSLIGLILVHGMLGMPLAFLVLRWHLEAEGEERELAARGLGATPWQAFVRVTMPLARPALAVAFVGAFVLSLNEGMASLFLATPSTETLPAAVWPLLKDAASPLVAVASSASILAGLLVVLAWLRR